MTAVSTISTMKVERPLDRIGSQGTWPAQFRLRRWVELREAGRERMSLAPNLRPFVLGDATGSEARVRGLEP